MGRMHFCDQHSYGGNLPCPACMGFQVGTSETVETIRNQRDRYRVALEKIANYSHRSSSELKDVARAALGRA